VYNTKRRCKAAGLDCLRARRPDWDNYNTLYELYEWWTSIRPVKHKELERLYDFDYKFGEDTAETDEKFCKAQEFEEELEKEDTEMLIKLITIRGSLWT
jgi:hypothetical protein